MLNAFHLLLQKVKVIPAKDAQEFPERNEKYRNTNSAN